MGLNTILPGRLHAAIAAVAPIAGVRDLNAIAKTATVDFLAAATTPQRNAANAIPATFDWSAAADSAFVAQQQDAAAAVNVDAPTDPQTRVAVALALLMLDEINILRAAVVPSLQARTSAQVIAALKAKINALT
jgi:hypothetical protein